MIFCMKVIYADAGISLGCWINKFQSGNRVAIHRAFDQCLNHLGARLAALPTNCLLNNGNVERELKFLTACHLEKLRGFSYVMEKTLPGHSHQPIDLIAFRNARTVFSAEFKCTFSNDTPQRVIAKACNQATAIRATKFPKLRGVPGRPVPVYIVHFLNHSTPASLAGLYPSWIRKKYPTGLARINLRTLQRKYSAALRARRITGAAYHNFEHNANLHSLVIELP